MKLSYVAFACLILSSCRTTSTSDVAGQRDISTERPQLCAAIRGNGHYISTHFGALARITEDIGWIDAVAGGSSASISSFVYESMRLNPGVIACDGCDDQTRRMRLSLLLKSTRGLIDALQNTPEALALGGLLAEVNRMQSEIAAERTASGLQIAKHILTIASSSNIAELLNWELFGMLFSASREGLLELGPNGVRRLLERPDEALVRIQQNRNIKFAVEQIQLAFATFGAFKADSQEIFFRPGVIDFYAFAEVIGRVGNFYAGRGPYDRDGMESFLAECSQPAFGKPWSEFSRQGEIGPRCAKQFADLVNNFFTQHPRERPEYSRLNDPIGATIAALISTSVIDGTSDLAVLNRSQERYWRQQSPDFKLSFNRIFAGHWGPKSLSQTVCNQVRTTDGEKGNRCLALGEEPWGNVLPFSPAEPGLSRALKLPSGDRASVGGWIDLAPTSVLKAAGCAHTIYITRRRDESVFVTGVARQLNMDKESTGNPVERALWDLDDRQSSFSRALSAADLVWCTDWNSFSDFEIDPMMDEAYCSEIILNNNRMPIGPYTRSQLITDPIRGCSVGAPAGTPRASRQICGRPRSL
jgi:hypothetical protein